MSDTALIGEVNEDAIHRLVDTFYGKVRSDPELAPIFSRAIPGDWEPHLATMRAFWSSVMLTSGRYKGNPMIKHMRLEGMQPQLFTRWLALFDEACRELFEPELGDAFRVRAERIAESLKLGIFYKPGQSWPPTA